MCARYNLRMSPAKLAQVFVTVREIEFRQRFNISPTQTVVAIRQEDGKRVPANLRWGLVPMWSKDPKSGPPLINARGETVAEKPAFRSAFKKRRCLIPATGFYEWRTEGKAKLPFNIHLPKDEPFAFAGLWECWDKGAEPLESCTIITTESTGDMAKLHDRQPVILHRNEWDVWLDPDLQEPEPLEAMIRPWDGKLVFDSIDPAINSSRNEGEQFFKPGTEKL
ncbi:Putative SOS response-associated peptidase YedK [Caulifigura coniformis]|uniref:Abasic site processing protein n=1 Tax=Caulifigura coniformis TaxID=2527983 RepID=A0A517SMA0_9PLAN|nr:SOS response-associated peptidase [Caulifigura coniformis]QDT57252.1 Putative SOS response-associated peptidase YedK [Caulifigura coniformis]